MRKELAAKRQHDQSLETQTKAGVRHGAEPSQVSVPGRARTNKLVTHGAQTIKRTTSNPVVRVPFP